MLHAAEEAILEHVVRAVHPVGYLDREAVDGSLVLSRGGDFGDDDGEVRVQVVHILDLGDGGVAGGAVVVHAEVVGRVAGDFAHKVGDPGVAGGVAGAGGADELVALGAEGEHLVVPGVGGLLC